MRSRSLTLQYKILHTLCVFCTLPCSFDVGSNVSDTFRRLEDRGPGTRRNVDRWGGVTSSHLLRAYHILFQIAQHPLESVVLQPVSVEELHHRLARGMFP